jgi:hypothetical protein
MQAVRFKTCVGKITAALRSSTTKYEDLRENFPPLCIYVSGTKFIVAIP